MGFSVQVNNELFACSVSLARDYIQRCLAAELKLVHVAAGAIKHVAVFLSMFIWYCPRHVAPGPERMLMQLGFFRRFACMTSWTVPLRRTVRCQWLGPSALESPGLGHGALGSPPSPSGA